ncbi:MAG: class I SAM-dependent methyltransferase, partial [Phenylobacterium sp.]
MNGRFAARFAQTMLVGPKAEGDPAAFADHCAQRGFEFTTDWADNNVPYVAPLLRDFATGRGPLRYLEIGAYEGKNLALMDWLLP